MNFATVLFAIVRLILALDITTRREQEVCGYAPLCGTAPSVFDYMDPLSAASYVMTSPIQNIGENMTLLAAHQSTLNPCCPLKDTTPQEDCQVINPTGEAERYFESRHSIQKLVNDSLELSLASSVSDVNDYPCEDLQMIIKPVFTRSASSMCCHSCTCYGDPVCNSFSGVDRTWVLCDGRDPIESRYPLLPGATQDCRITKEMCDTQLDHAGNQCQYQSPHKYGKGWDVSQLGSPCIPNENSPASNIVMYDVLDQFKLVLEQGERGIILAVHLEIKDDTFYLSADRCVEQGPNAWLVNGEQNTTLPSFFHYANVIQGYDVLWNMVDPETHIGVFLRCYANRPSSFVPRINVEELSEPETRVASGFCVEDELDYGLATINEEGDKCSTQIENTLEVHKAICQNEALPYSGILDCRQRFCESNYIPLFNSVQHCKRTMRDDLEKGFCRAINYNNEDVTKCRNQWRELGALTTINQYIGDTTQCESLSALADYVERYREFGVMDCEEGLMVEYFDEDKWKSAFFIPSSVCASSTGLQYTKCEAEGLGLPLMEKPIRITQKEAGTLCSLSNRCVRVDGVNTFIGLVGPEESLPPTPPPVLIIGDCEEPELCGTVSIYEDLSSDAAFSTNLEACCPEKYCPGYETPMQTRTAGTTEAFCRPQRRGDSFLSKACKNKDTLQLTIDFESRLEDIECCDTCTCFGDPRCYSFDNVFKEFVLCDARTPNLDALNDRCIIRKDTCDNQVDHMGNVCKWVGPSSSDEDEQAAIEDEFKVMKSGSPCQYDSDISPPSEVLLYSIEEPGYELSVQQFDRGYMKSVFLTIGDIEYSLHVDQGGTQNCVWYSSSHMTVKTTERVGNVSFIEKQEGRETKWTVIDLATGIELDLRCTGVLYRGKFSQRFINIEGLNEPRRRFREDPEGFCVSNLIDETALSSSNYTDWLKENSYCDGWNAASTRTTLRDTARILTSSPSVSFLGTGYAFTSYCEGVGLRGDNKKACSRKFMNSNTVEDIYAAFCASVAGFHDRKSNKLACMEHLEVVASTESFEEVLAMALEQYVEEKELGTCFIESKKIDSKLRTNLKDCEPGVVLEFMHRTRGWTKYKSFPQGKCDQFKAEFSFREHPKLFENPIRIYQEHEFDKCSSCGGVKGFSASWQYLSS